MEDKNQEDLKVYMSLHVSMLKKQSKEVQESWERGKKLYLNKIAKVKECARG